ncbi:hypothetical protein ACX0G9_00635 [Flavitalea flava]
MRLKASIFIGLVVSAFFYLGGCSKSPGGNTNSCDTTGVTYRNDILPIIKNYCFSCHSNATMAFSNHSVYNFEQGDSLGYAYFKFEDIVVHEVRHDPGYIGMPYLKPKIPECAVNKIVAWFNNPVHPY